MKKMRVVRIKEDGEFIFYHHHDRDVWVRCDLVGEHRKYCLCFSCAFFEECDVTKALYSFCMRHNMIAPVWECPEFKRKEIEKENREKT